MDFRHYLLQVTGQFLGQPIVDDSVVCLFNGELYSQDFEISDGEIIIPLYRRCGANFARHLDGEYAIAIYDFQKRLIFFATDPFGTKPLWTDGVYCASYFSAVGGLRTPPNSTIVRRFTGETIAKLQNVEFDFSSQHKESYYDWLKAFRSAVKKRATDSCYIGLSSGYDSGAIGCELSRLGIEFQTYSLPGAEHTPTLLSRQRLLGGRQLKLDSKIYRFEREYLEHFCEPYRYDRDAGLTVCWKNMHDDSGAIGASIIHRAARLEGRKVFLSGQGADEILADYAKSSDVSDLRGVFPAKLAAWPNFNHKCQLAYLTKEEFVAGAHGVEGRYPFLDKALVQEFLWLSPELKNKAYKAPLREYLLSEQFPFREDEKIGFELIV